MASAALHLNYHLLSKPKCSFMNQELYECVFGCDGRAVLRRHILYGCLSDRADLCGCA